MRTHTHLRRGEAMMAECEWKQREETDEENKGTWWRNFTLNVTLNCFEKKGWSENSRRPDLDAEELFSMLLLEDTILHYVENCHNSEGARWCTVYWWTDCIFSLSYCRWDIYIFFNVTARKSILCFSDDAAANSVQSLNLLTWFTWFRD